MMLHDRVLELDRIWSLVAPPSEPQRWTDYAGDLPYIDYDVTDNGNGTATVSDTRRYLADGGIASQYDFATQQTTYLHGDMLHSTVLTTNSAGLADESFAYTAFGEAVTSDGQAGWQVGFPPTDPATRYRYAGGWGYVSARSKAGNGWLAACEGSGSGRSGGGLSGGWCGGSEACLPFARDQLGDTLGRVGVDAHQHVAEVGERVDAGQLTRDDQAEEGRRVLCTIFTAREEPVLAVMLNSA